MQKLTREDLYSLEQYAEMRGDFRAKVMAHKRYRKVAIGPNATLYFEDRLTIQYQIQEMLRAERIFEAAGINDELEAYNPLIPEGKNWKGTFMIEYSDEAERRIELTKLKGIEKSIWVRVDGLAPVHPIANEDLERENDDKTSSVHFLRFELDAEMIAALKDGAQLSMGIDHDHYRHQVAVVEAETVKALVADLD